MGRPCTGCMAAMPERTRSLLNSDAVKNASLTWDESTLDRWLTDTESVIPDNDMTFRLNDAAERANIIAYLRQLSGK